MPRYNYQCDHCDDMVTIFHTIDEQYTDCLQCGQKDKMVKLLSAPIILKDRDILHNNDRKIGELTKEYIDENKRLLEQQKKEAKGEEHEPS